MIPARQSRFFSWWFSRHAEGRLRSAFEAVYVRGLEATLDVAQRSPIILVSNHTSWWDTMVSVYLVPRRMRLDGYAMMDEANLRKLPFFAKVGAFGVDLSGGGAARESLEYATSLLDRPGRLVWIYAQGRERASTKRPLGFRRGSAVIALAAPRAAVVPFGIRYEVAGTERPLLFLSFGEPLERASSVDDERARQEAGVTTLLDAMDGVVCDLRDRVLSAPVEAGFATLLDGRSRRLDRVAQVTLSWLTRGAIDRRRRRAGPDGRAGASALPTSRGEP
jgi:1-acyl-sn-glycerol-3-phosphate acyltransferase